MAKGEDNPIKRAVINAASSGNNTVITGVAGMRFRVLGYHFVVDSAVAVTWEEGVDIALSGAMSYAAKGGFTVAETYIGCLETATAGNDLVLSLSGAVGVRGHLSYQEFEEITT
jgi:hypothetical protein